MSNKPVKVYTFTVPANGAFPLLVISDYFRLQSATGAVDVSGDTFGTLPDLLTGQGLENTPYNRLVFTDKTGAPNTVSVLCSGDLFIDNRTYGVVSIAGAVDFSASSTLALHTPLSGSGSYKNAAVVLANVAQNVFTAAANINGAVVLTATASDVGPSAYITCLLSKATAPANINDGDPIMATTYRGAVTGASYSSGGFLSQAQYVAPGLGLWFISTADTTLACQQTCRYRLL